MAAARLHLIKRNSVYYWRRRLPAGIAPHFGKSHLVVSTRLTGLLPASRLARRLSVILDRFLVCMEHIRRPPTAQEIKDLLEEVRTVIDERYELGRAVRADMGLAPGEGEIPGLVGFEINSNEDIDAYEAIEAQYYRDNPKEAAKQYERDHATAISIDFWDPERLRQQWQEALANEHLAPIRELLDEMLATKGFALDPDSMAYRLLAVKALKSGTAALETVAERYLAPSREVAVIESPPTGAPASRALAPIVGPTYELPMLAASIERFRKSKARSAWDTKAQRDGEVAFRFMLDFFGDIPMSDIRKSNARDFLDALARVPSHHGKAPFVSQVRRNVPQRQTKLPSKNRAQFDYRPYPLQSLIAMADDIVAGLESGDPDFSKYDDKPWVDDGTVNRLSLKTQNKYLTYAHGLFDFVLEEADLTARNPFDNLLHSKASIERDQGDGRRAWPKEALSNLFHSPIWSGCLSENRRAAAGECFIRDAKFWVPLLGAYAGMRLEEACQLKVENIVEIENLQCIAIRRGHGQHLKNSESVREIPIHRNLIEFGFLDFVNSKRLAGDEWLFAELEPAGPHKLRGYTFSKQFTEYRKAINLYEPWLDFHALRHSFITNLQLRRQPTEQIAALVGHTRKGMTSRVYFKGFSASDMNETLQALDYDIDLRHLSRRS